MASSDIIDIYFKIGVDDKPLEEGLDNAGKKTLKFGDILKANLISSAVEKGLSTLYNGIKNVASVISNNLTPAVSRLDTLNSYGKTMEALGFSTDQATEAQNKLSNAIDGLPTTLDGIISWQQQFTALTDDIEGATDLTIALNNATLAAGKGQEVANNAMGNWYAIIASGMPDAQHWQSLYSAMPAQMNQLAEAVMGAGAKSDDLFQAWKNGEVTLEQVTTALVALNSQGLEGIASFEDQAQIGAQTIATAYGNISTAIGKNIAKVLDVLNGDTSEGGGRIVELLLSVKTLINDIGTSVSNFVKEHEPEVSAIMNAINAIFKGEDVGANFKTLLTNISAIIKDLLDRAKNFFLENKDAITETIVDMFTSFVETLLELIPVLLPIAVAMLSALCTTIVENLPMIIESAVQVVLALVQGLVDSMPTLIPTIVDVIILILNTIVDNLGFILEAALQIIASLALGLIDALPKLADAIPKITGKIIAVIILHLPDIIACAAQIISALCYGLIGALPEIVGSVYTLIDTIIKELQNGFDDMIERAGNWGVDLINNFISGVKSMWSNFTNSIGEFTGFIANNMGFSEPKEGPLSNFHTYAPDMVDLFTTGLYQNEDKLRDAFEDVLQVPEIDDIQMPANSGYGGSRTGYSNGTNAIELTATVPIYIAGKKIDQQIITANAEYSVVSGGR